MSKQRFRLSARYADAWVRWKTGALTAQGRLLFERRLQRDAVERARLEELEGLWNELGLFPAEFLPESAPGPHRVEAPAAGRMAACGRGRPLVARVTAAATVLLAAGLLLWHLFDDGGWSSYRTTSGERLLINLADDTVVHLNANTRVAIDIDGKQRTVQLKEGEGLFDVAEDAQRRFVVYTSAGSVEAIGTRFNVQTSPSEFTVTVIEGVVLVSNHTADRMRHVAQYVQRGQQVVVGDDGLISSAVIPDVEAVVSWAHSKLVFSGEPLEKVVERVNRHSKHRIEIQDARLHHLLVYGVFNAGDTRGFLAALEQSYPLQSISHSRDVTYLVYRDPAVPDAPAGRAGDPRR